MSHTCRSDVPLLRRFLAVLGGSILAAHGLAHLIGVASLSEHDPYAVFTDLGDTDAVLRAIDA